MNIQTGATILAVSAAIGTAIYALGKAHEANVKMAKIAAKLNATLDDVSDSIEFDAKDISDIIIEEAVDKAVDKAAKDAAERAISKVIHKFDDDISSAVKREVEAEKDNMKGKIKEQIDKQIGYIDISEAKREVIEAAKATAAERFNTDLDAVLAKHNEELKSIQTIYSSIAKSMKGE